MSLPEVRIKGRRNNPHPWIWKTRIDLRSVPRRHDNGGLVRVFDGDGQAIGVGMLHPHVTIALRMLTSDPQERVNTAFFVRRLESALRLRRDVLHLEEAGDSYRLVHAEADGLSGVVIDVFADVVRVDMFSRGMSLLEAPLREALGQVLPGKRVVVRADRRSSEVENFGVKPRKGDPDSVRVTEHGLRFHVDLREGHKTGFFLDQRENRAFLAGLARGKRLLDMHCYTGGFSIHAAKAGAEEVTGIDIDEKAVAVAKKNAKLNQVRARFRQSDAFPYLRDLVRGDRPRPEVLILDPPKLVLGQKEREEGLRVYRDLNRLGLEAVADDGILLTCSCSGAVSEQDLLDVLRNSAARTGKELTVFRVSGAAADHPVGLHVPETRYLKAVFARVRSL